MDCASVLKRGYLVDKKASRLVSTRYDLLVLAAMSVCVLVV